MSLNREAKHGWEIVDDAGKSARINILTFDRFHSRYPVVAMADSGEMYAAATDGKSVAVVGGFHLPGWTLRDAPPPKATGVDWIVRWRSDNGYRRHAALHYTKEAASAHARFLISKGRSHVSVIEAPWTEGMGLEAESSDE